MTLPTFWFILIAVLWIGYLFLEGFDLGVGMHMRILARDEKERRLLLNTIGPVWDGNEVWLITAGGATFAAFPLWYAALFSALYIPLLLVLVGLIFRAVAIEYRGKGDTQRWRDFWTWAIALGSLVAAFGIGAALALTTTGLPLDEHGDRVGGWHAVLNRYAIIGGLAVVGFALIHGAAFVMLKTDGDMRHRARAFAMKWMPLLLLPLVAWVLIVQFDNGKVWTWLMVAIAVVAVVFSWLSLRSAREMPAFAGLAVFLLAGAIAIFGAVYPVVLPSTLDSAWDLTVHNAASSSYTLKVMTGVALFGVPLVLVYQGWSYWVFRKRISMAHIPETHPFPAQVGDGRHADSGD
jgi:cytochrome d ubiquinol oxidase subunit II